MTNGNGKPCQALIFVYPELSHGQILEATGDFLVEAIEHSWIMDDHEMMMPVVPGIQIFEGWVEVGVGEDPDIRWFGSWRLLTHWEMCRVRHGMSPFGDPVVEP